MAKKSYYLHSSLVLLKVRILLKHWKMDIDLHSSLVLLKGKAMLDTIDRAIEFTF